MFKFFGSKTDSDIDHIMEMSKGQFVEFERFKQLSVQTKFEILIYCAFVILQTKDL